MANELDNTALDPIVPENWRPRFVERFYDSKSALPRFLNATEDYQDHGGKGDIANITVEGFDLTVNDTSADGSLTVQTQTLTNIALNVNKWKDVTMEVVNKSRKQAFSVWEDQFPTSAGNAVRRKMMSDLLAEYSNATLAAQGDGTGRLGEEEILGAIQQHLDAGFPIDEKPEDWTFVLPTVDFSNLKKGNMLDYSRTGKPGIGGAATIDLPMLYDIPVVFSTQVASAAGIRYGLLAHRSALAWAAQQNVEPRFADRLPAGKASYLMTVGALYGVKTVVAGRMGQLKSKA
jgi:hypothetical protein